MYNDFLSRDLAGRAAIRGQLEGPVSFGFNILDQDDRPILFDDSIRPFMFEFMAKRINVQLARLKERNANAFMFIDEPGLQFIFSAMSVTGSRRPKPTWMLSLRWSTTRGASISAAIPTGISS